MGLVEIFNKAVHQIEIYVGQVPTTNLDDYEFIYANLRQPRNNIATIKNF